jgi:hypothetical protein
MEFPLSNDLTGEARQNQRATRRLAAAQRLELAARTGASDTVALDRSGTLEDAAYEQMRQALIDGHFSPGHLGCDGR